eukprot:gene4936-biopygen9613
MHPSMEVRGSSGNPPEGRLGPECLQVEHAEPERLLEEEEGEPPAGRGGDAAAEPRARAPREAHAEQQGRA